MYNKNGFDYVWCVQSLIDTRWELANKLHWVYCPLSQAMVWISAQQRNFSKAAFPAFKKQMHDKNIAINQTVWIGCFRRLSIEMYRSRKLCFSWPAWIHLQAHFRALEQSWLTQAVPICQVQSQRMYCSYTDMLNMCMHKSTALALKTIPKYLQHVPTITRIPMHESQAEVDGRVRTITWDDLSAWDSGYAYATSWLLRTYRTSNKYLWQWNNSASLITYYVCQTTCEQNMFYKHGTHLTSWIRLLASLQNAIRCSSTNTAMIKTLVLNTQTCSRNL